MFLSVISRFVMKLLLLIILNFPWSITQEKRRRAKEDMSAMEEEMAAASAQMKAREEENLTKQTPSVRLVNLVLWKENFLSLKKEFEINKFLFLCLSIEDALACLPEASS